MCTDMNKCAIVLCFHVVYTSQSFIRYKTECSMSMTSIDCLLLQVVSIVRFSAFVQSILPQVTPCEGHNLF